MSRRVVLTASHCMEVREFSTGWGTTVWSTLDEEIADEGSWSVGENVHRLSGTPLPDPCHYGSPHYRYERLG